MVNVWQKIIATTLTIVAQNPPAKNHYRGPTSQKNASFTTIHEATDRNVKKLDNKGTVAIPEALSCICGQPRISQNNSATQSRQMANRKPDRPALRLAPLVLVALSLIAVLSSAQVDFALMRDVAQARYGDDTAQLVEQWHTEITRIQQLPERDKLERVNGFFNSRIRWVPDLEVWHQDDYWATPLELMGRRMGDCEDFAIAKYTMLVLAGVDVSRLRITYVKAQPRSPQGARATAHMVLAYYPDTRGEPVVLDNIVKDIRPASQRTDLIPVYGFNSLGLWVGGAANPASTQPEAKLSRWRDLLRRAAGEGLQ